MYLFNENKNPEKYWAYDIEADSLTPTTVWCICLTNVWTKEKVKFHGSLADISTGFASFVMAHPDAYWVGHNVLSYDNPALSRLCGIVLPFDRVIDTLVMSYLYHPTMPGGHSLAAWGDRFGFPKVVHEDWSQYSPAMLNRCEVDVDLTIKVFLGLSGRMFSRGYSDRSLRLEHAFRVIINDQERTGFYFNIPAAHELYARLREKELGLSLPIRELFPPLLVCQGEYDYRTKGDGTPFASYLRHVDKYEKIEFNEDRTKYRVYSFEDFNIGSPKQRSERLLALGYKPTQFTPTGLPKVDEESLLEFVKESGEQGVKAMAEWLVVNGRANMLNTWLNNVDYADSCMHGKVFSCGAGTRRCTHSGPNTANVPGVEVPYGSEVRSLWEARPGRVLVGTDAKACQMRMFGHYLDNPVVSDRYINGDPHQANADFINAITGFDTPRKKHKNGFFAFIFGCAPTKYATTLGIPVRKGKVALEALYDANPGLRELINEVQTEWAENDGFLKCIDGGFVRCPSPHAALNYRIQSAEKCQMAQAAVFADAEKTKRGLDALWVGNIHDEWQVDCATKDAETWGEVSVQAMRDAGEELGFRVPMDGTYSIGANWAETH